jgi:hypothetical protein
MRLLTFLIDVHLLSFLNINWMSENVCFGIKALFSDKVVDSCYNRNNVFLSGGKNGSGSFKEIKARSATRIDAAAARKN